jgi:hypothetical protein
MILQALNNILNEVMDSHALIGDIEADLPFCVFRADTQPHRTKDGICGYDHIVNVGIIDNEIESVNTYTESVITAMTAKENTIISGTKIYAVIQTDESGIYYENENNVYMNDLEFKVFTKNR